MMIRFLDPMADSMRELERNLHEAFSTPTSLFWGERGVFPTVDIVEHQDAYELVFELPGVKREDVKVSVEEDVLLVSGERKHYGFPEGTKVIRHETMTKPFSRSFELPEDVDRTRIGAELNNGILRVTLPKAEHARPREITIK